MEIKWTGNCPHIAEENTRNMENVINMKQQGGRRNSPQEYPDVMVEVVHSVIQYSGTKLDLSNI